MLHSKKAFDKAPHHSGNIKLSDSACFGALSQSSKAAKGTSGLGRWLSILREFLCLYRGNNIAAMESGCFVS